MDRLGYVLPTAKKAKAVGRRDLKRKQDLITERDNDHTPEGIGFLGKHKKDLLVFAEFGEWFDVFLEVLVALGVEACVGLGIGASEVLRMKRQDTGPIELEEHLREVLEFVEKLGGLGRG